MTSAMKKNGCFRIFLCLSLAAAVLLSCEQKKDEVVENVVMLKRVKFEQKRSDKGDLILDAVEIDTLAPKEVSERSANIKSLTRITNNEDPNTGFRGLAFSPVDDLLVYDLITPSLKSPVAQAPQDAQDSKNSQKKPQSSSRFSINLWSQEIGSFGKSRITSGNYSDIYPEFYPDGKRLLFSSDRAGTYRTIWSVNVSGGGGTTRLTNSMATDSMPSVSRSGDTIAYTSFPVGAAEGQIWTIDKNGNMVTQLGEGIMPKISPDGSKILFLKKNSDNACDRDGVERGVYQMWVMNADGSGETQLTNNVDYCITDPSWSPDGRYVAFSSNEALDADKRRNYDIWMMSVDGSKKRQLTTNGSMDFSPVWDRMGENIYFVSNRGGYWNVWRFSPTF